MSLKPNPESTPESWEGNKAVYGISENMAHRRAAVTDQVWNPHYMSGGDNDL